jgi:hypothetical protein
MTSLSAVDASATASGNKGTIKIHEFGTPSGTESNDPKICGKFNIETFDSTPGLTGYLQFETQGGDKPTGENAGPFTWGPVGSNGYHATQYFTLKDGHYMAVVYGKKSPEGVLSDIKAKSKVFKVQCGGQEEPPAAGKPSATIGQDCEVLEGWHSGDTIVTYTLDNLKVKKATEFTLLTAIDGKVSASTKTVAAKDSFTKSDPYSAENGKQVGIEIRVGDKVLASTEFKTSACPKSVPETPDFIVDVSVNKGSCTVVVPKASVTITGEASIGYLLAGQGHQPVWQHREVSAGTYTVTLPKVKPGSTTKFFIVVSPLDDSVALFTSEEYSFSVPAKCDKPEAPEPQKATYVQGCDYITFTNPKTNSVALDGAVGVPNGVVVAKFTLKPSESRTVKTTLKTVFYVFTVARTGEPIHNDGYIKLSQKCSTPETPETPEPPQKPTTPSTPEFKCPHGTTGSDLNHNGMVDKGECNTPVKHAPPPSEDEGGIAAASSSPFLPIGAVIALALTGYRISRRRQLN